MHYAAMLLTLLLQLALFPCFLATQIALDIVLPIIIVWRLFHWIEWAATQARTAIEQRVQVCELTPNRNALQNHLPFWLGAKHGMPTQMVVCRAASVCNGWVPYMQYCTYYCSSRLCQTAAVSWAC